MPRMHAGDGAASGVRKQLGIALDGPGSLQSLINIHFTSTTLGQKLLEQPAMLYFVFGYSGVLVLVAHDLKTGVFGCGCLSVSSFTFQNAISAAENKKIESECHHMQLQ
jgi:hypothetical protein